MTQTPDNLSAPLAAKPTLSTTRILLVVVALAAAVYLTPIDPRGWMVVATAAGAAALPEGRAASIVAKVVLSLTLLAVLACFLLFAGFYIWLVYGGGTIG